MASALLHVAVAAFVTRWAPSPRRPGPEGRDRERLIEVEYDLPRAPAERPSPPETEPVAARSERSPPRLPDEASPTTASSDRRSHDATATPPPLPPSPASSTGGPDVTDRLWLLRQPAALPSLAFAGNGPADTRADGTRLGTLAAPPTAAGPTDDPGARPGRPLNGSIDGRGGVTMDVEEDGSIAKFRDPTVKHVGLGIVFDLSDSVMRALGEDPYAYEKRRLMDETRDARHALMAKTTEARRHQALTELKARLAAIANLPNLAPAAQRALFFDLWDECLPAGDDADGAWGARARTTIIEAAGRHFPAGSPRAYPQAELAELNSHRSSKEAFAPYAQMPPSHEGEADARRP